MQHPSSSDNRHAEIEALADRFVEALNAEEPQSEAALCDGHPHLMPELADELALARRVFDMQRSTAKVAVPAPPLAIVVAKRGSEPGPSRLPRDFGPYSLREELGGGGFATVYRAVDTRTGQPVAVKIPHEYRSADPRAAERFRVEPEIARRLDHSHIVSVLDAGEIDGQAFLAMPLVDGIDLQRETRSRPCEPRRGAEIVRQITEACAYAHARGIAHRDIKPANILIDNETGDALLTDFGLARRLDASEMLTGSAEVLGTLHYMPPEQADPDLGPIGPASDIYALGATLYFLLTGRPPFPRKPGATAAAIRQEVVWKSPLPLPETVPAALRRICRKCLEKMPIDRYVTAAELAADLQRFLDGREPLGRLPGPVRRVHALFQRRPLLASGVATLALLLVITAGVAVEASLRADSSEADRLQQVGLTKSAQAEAGTATVRKITQEYAALMQDADARRAAGDLDQVAAALAKFEHPETHDPRGFEWWYLRNLVRSPSLIKIDAPGDGWNRIAFDASGERLALVDRDGTLVVRNLAANSEAFRSTERVKSVDFDPAGKYCVTLTANTVADVHVRQASDGKLLGTFPVGQFVTCMAVQPDGKAILTANVGGEIFLWQLPSGKRIAEVTATYKQGGGIRSLDLEHGAILDIAVSPDGTSFATGHQDGTAQIWSLAERKIICRGPPLAKGPVTGVTFSPDSSLVASQDIGAYSRRLAYFEHGAIRVWRADNAEIVSEFVPHRDAINDSPLIEKVDHVIPFGQFRPVFHPEGKRLITTGPRTVQVRNPATGQVVDEYIGTSGVVSAAAVSPDGRQVAAIGKDGAAHVWPTTGGPCVTVCTHDRAIHAIALSADGKRLAAYCERSEGPNLGRDGFYEPRSDSRCLRVWDAESGDHLAYVNDVYSPLEHIAFVRQDSRVLVGGSCYSIEPSPKSEAFFADPYPSPTTIREDAWLPANEAFAARIQWSKSTATLVDLKSGRTIAELTGDFKRVSAAAVSPDGKWVAAGDKKGELRLFSAADGRLVRTYHETGAEVTTIVFAPASFQLAVGYMDHEVRVWSIADAKQVHLCHGHRREITSLAFTHDGRRIASASGRLTITSQQPGEVFLWDMATGLRLLELQVGPNHVYGGLAFSPDDCRLYASGNPLGGVAAGRIVTWDAPRQ